MSLKKILTVLLSACLILGLAGCASGQDKLYSAGIELAEIMEEMIESDEYSSIMGGQISGVIDLRETIGHVDFDEPEAVYSIELPDAEDFLDTAGYSGNDDWDELSDELQQQITNRISVSTLISSYHSAKGSYAVAFSALYTALLYKDDISPEQTTVYLYEFEDGAAIAVTFHPHGQMNGQFVLLGEDDAEDVFEKLGCKVKELDI